MFATQIAYRSGTGSKIKYYYQRAEGRVPPAPAAVPGDGRAITTTTPPLPNYVSLKLSATQNPKRDLRLPSAVLPPPSFPPPRQRHRPPATTLGPKPSPRPPPRLASPHLSRGGGSPHGCPGAAGAARGCPERPPQKRGAAATPPRCRRRHAARRPPTRGGRRRQPESRGGGRRGETANQSGRRCGGARREL